jgi:hypothetical protein
MSIQKNPTIFFFCAVLCIVFISVFYFRSSVIAFPFVEQLPFWDTIGNQRDLACFDVLKAEGFFAGNNNSYLNVFNQKQDFFEKENTRILLLGDSMTYWNEIGGYNLPLCELLTDKNMNFYFVGSEKIDSNLVPKNCLHYCAWPGITVETLLDEAKRCIKEQKPDLILLNAGTNNVMKENSDLVISRYENLLSIIFETAPDVTVVVSSLINSPRLDGNYPRLACFNYKLFNLTRKKNSFGKNIFFLDLNSTDFLREDFADDNIHVKVSGQRKIAGTWFEFIQ